MLDISFIILTYNEQLHIERCIKNIQPIAKEVFVIDSYSEDNTVKLAEQLGAKVYSYTWEYSHAKKFNWALDNVPIKTKWVFRLDADEYLTPELIEEIKERLDTVDESITGLVFNRRVIFMGKWMKRGTYPVKMLRLFHFEKARAEPRWMDDHMQLLEGEELEFKYDFVDENLSNLGWWINKHNGYAVREAIELLDLEMGLLSDDKSERLLTDQAARKRKLKLRFAKQALFWRSFVYFLYRYFFKLGLLEGKVGFLWTFFQGFWYRMLVDAYVFEIKKHCGVDKQKIKAYLEQQYHIKI